MPAEEDINPKYLIPRNRVDKQREQEVSSMANFMKINGWSGRPLLVVDDEAITGSHRLAAAKQANISVPTVKIPEDVAHNFNEWLKTNPDNTWSLDLTNWLGQDDESKLHDLKRAREDGINGLDSAIDLMQQEVNNNNLPKTEDGKIDWEGFKTKGMEVAKPLAALAPIGGISFMPQGKEEKVVELSTSLPKSEKTQIDPVTQNRQVNIATASQDKQFLTKLADKMTDYDFVSPKIKKLTPEKRVQAFKDFMVQNYLYLHDQMPEELRNRAKLWYDGARRISEAWGNRYGVRPEAIGGIIACLSPQRDWFQNVSMAERLLDIWKERDSLKWSNEMQDRSKTLFDMSKPVHKKLLESITGKDFKDLNDPVEQAAWARLHDSAHNEKYYRIISPEGDFLDYQKSTKTGEKNAIQWCGFDTIAKVMRILESPDDNAILSKQLGAAHKVRSFYNNIVAPKSPRGEVTSDTHNVAAGLLLPLGGSADEVLANLGAAPNSDIIGIYGTYPVYADAVRDAAKQRGVLPREMQSITWEAVRSLFENKSANQIAKTKAIWQDYAKGKITHEQAIKQIVEISGGFRPLDWRESNYRLAPEKGGASYAR